MSLNNGQYKSDDASNGVTYATNGKTIVDTPATMLKSVLSCDSSTLFANLGLDVMAKRHYTDLNQGAVAGRTLPNTSVGYRLGGLASLKDLTVQLTVNNLKDQKYISTLGSNGFVNSDPKGTEQTILPGAPRSIFIGLSAKAQTQAGAVDAGQVGRVHHQWQVGNAEAGFRGRRPRYLGAALQGALSAAGWSPVRLPGPQGALGILFVSGSTAEPYRSTTQGCP